jgi:hypothetical protein
MVIEYNRDRKMGMAKNDMGYEGMCLLYIYPAVIYLKKFKIPQILIAETLYNSLYYQKLTKDIYNRYIDSLFI